MNVNKAHNAALWPPSPALPSFPAATHFALSPEDTLGLLEPVLLTGGAGHAWELISSIKIHKYLSQGLASRVRLKFIHKSPPRPQHDTTRH